MHHRVFMVDEALERELLAARSGRGGAPALVEALARDGFRIAEEDAAQLAETILGRLQDANDATVPLRGFVIRTREDGAVWLCGYFNRDIGVSLVMEGAEDCDVTSQKIGSVGFYTRRNDGSEVVIPQGVTVIGQHCFGIHAGIKRIVVPEGVERIAHLAFSRCKDLEEVVLPQSVVSVETCAFARCPNLKTIALPKQLRTIGSLAFCGCERLERIALPDMVGELGYGVFANCAALEEVQIPAGLAIPAERHMFYGCDSLNVSDVRLGRSAAPIKTVLDELECAVESYADFYLSNEFSGYFFTIMEIDEPEEGYLDAQVSDEDLECDIRSFFEINTWLIEAFRDREGTEFMEAIVVDTLRSLGVEVFGYTEEGPVYYERGNNWFELISQRFLRINGRWYTMVLERFDTD